MNNKQNKTKRLTALALCASVALVLSYVEVLLPPLFTAIPGIKMGLANIAIIFALYRFGVREAAAVSLVRLVTVALLFGNAMTFIYSLAGATLSLAAMAILKHLDFLSMPTVSAAGGILHNLAQIVTAMILLETAAWADYMIVLALTGVVSGLLVGFAGYLAVKRIKI